MLSSTAEAALRATVRLARCEPRARTVQELAADTEISAPYLSKILQMLSRARLVRSRPGRGGGFSLRGPASGISAWEVIQAVDPWKKIDRCPLDEPLPHCEQLCPLHRHLLAAHESAERALRNAMLRDLAGPFTPEPAAGSDSPRLPESRERTAPVPSRKTPPDQEDVS